jgi:hypothetical protein
MRKLKAVKARVILGIFLFSIFVAFLPSYSVALGIFQGNIELNYDVNDIPNTIRPETDTVRADVYVNHYASGLGSQLVIPFFSANTVQIELSVGDTPDWLEANIAPGVVYTKLRTEKSPTPEPAILTVTLKPYAPAFQAETVELIARHGDITPISSALMKLPITIKSGYYSNFRYQYTTFDEIGAAETITFPITITGYANYRSKLQFKVLDPPEGWSTSINSEFLLGTAAFGENSTGVVDFTIQAPLDFGYYNQVEQFNVQVQTMAAGHPEAGIDNTTILQFTVRARGFSTPGFEVAFSIISLIAIVIIYKKRKK